MLLVDKKIGETPLELIDRVRVEKPELENETLSYAGRLDPMAEGQILILVGEKENKNRKKYLGYDKEYTATFLVGVSTDTGDILGLINKEQHLQINRDAIEKQVANLKNITTQTYPWFSGKAIAGIKLFDHFKAGNTGIARPSQNITIKRSALISISQIQTEELEKYITKSVSKVHGDFRQKEILKSWHNFFLKNTSELQTFKADLLVSSGTFIRSLCEEFPFPVTLIGLNRTKIHIDKI